MTPARSDADARQGRDGPSGRAVRLIDPVAAVAQARELRVKGDLAGAKAILAKVLLSHRSCAPAHYVGGLILSDLGKFEDALATFRHAALLDPNLPGVWLAIAEHAAREGDNKTERDAFARHVQFSARAPHIRTAAEALAANDFERAKGVLAKHLEGWPNDAAAMAMLAEVAARAGRLQDASDLFRRCLELAPYHGIARENYVGVLHRRKEYAEALRQSDLLLKTGSEANWHHYRRRAAILSALGDLNGAIDAFEHLLAHEPASVETCIAFGNALKGAGRQDEAVAWYRKALALEPGSAMAWWSISNLKTVRFSQADVEAMETILTGALDADRVLLHFALGKAFEDEKRFAESFAHYEQGNALKRVERPYDHARTDDLVARSKTLFTREFFAGRKGRGALAPDPIFIVGMPRAGSTLVEQILASHSAVEGTMELLFIRDMARRMASSFKPAGPVAYPDTLAHLSRSDLRKLGEEYLAHAKAYRHLGRPFFIDKMPNNFEHVGLIHLILPHAKIIDVRRDAMSCCFAGFKQLFAHGQHFSFSLDDIAHFYGRYVELMAHYDRVLPGRVHRLMYSDLVENPEREIRKLLDHCDLAFERSCLDFHKTPRSILTPSSEQVRQPIYRDGLGNWHGFAPWLGTLRQSLQAAGVPQRAA